MISVLILFVALAWLACGYAVNAGFCGLMESVYPTVRLSLDKLLAVTNLLFGPLGFIVLGLHWLEHGPRPFSWDWPRLLVREN